MTTPEIRIPKATSFTFNNKASSSMFGLPAFLLSHRQDVIYFYPSCSLQKSG